MTSHETRIRPLIWMALAFAALWMAGCGGGSSTAPDGDGADGDTPCTTDSNCPSGEVCGADQVCIPIDGDLPADGDDPNPTRIFRMTPDGTLDFGEVQLVDSAFADVVIYNDGNQAMHLYEATFTEPQVDNPWSLDGYMEATIQPGQSFTFKIRFQPIVLGENPGVLRISNDSDNMPEATLNLAGDAVKEIGEAEIGSDPDAVEFEEKALGTHAAQKRLKIGNLGTGSSQIIVTQVYMQSNGAQPFSYEHELEISEDEPLTIAASSSSPFTIWFDPITAGEYSDKLVVEYHTNLDSAGQVLEVPISGDAVIGQIYMTPPVLNFGSVPLFGAKPLDVRLSNKGDVGEINITSLRITGIDNWQTIFTSSAGGMDPVALAAGANHEFQLTFNPSAVENYDAELRVDTDFNGTSFYFPILAEGSARNEKPEARVSQVENGADIGAPLEIPVGSTKTFYGAISRDPDGNSGNLTFQWYLTKPPASVANLIPDTTSPTVSLLFDVAGNYLISLVVTDEQGDESDPKNVEVTATAGLSTMRIQASYSGISALSDVDLMYVIPLGNLYNEEVCAASTGTCQVPSAYGTINLMGCGSASVCTTETVTHAYAPDGTYEFRLNFDENCPYAVNDPLNYLCLTSLGKEEATATINIYIDNEDTPSFGPFQVDLTEKGQTERWNFTRNSGVWQAPVHLE